MQVASAADARLIPAVARMGARVRVEPSAAAKMTHELAKGTSLLLSSQVQNDSGSWWQITNPGYEGWVYSGDVQLP